jgi:hypothetical protein
MGAASVIRFFVVSYLFLGVLGIKNTLAQTPPTSTNFSISVSEDDSYAFTAGEFDFQDSDGDPFIAIRVETLPAEGSLTYNGSAFPVPFQINQADIPLLVYQPAPDEFGINYSSWDYSVFDGADYSITSYSVTIDVSGVNDTPEFNDIADQVVDEDVALQSIPISGISPGPNETQSISFSATSSAPAMVPDPVIDYTDGQTTATREYTPAANQSGTVIITVTADDGQGVNNTLQKK